MESLRLASLWSRALAGANAIPVAVEVHLGNGLPQFQIVGQADSEVQESRERVRVALQASGFEFPNARITVNLAPADLPKRSGHFDLPMALGLLIASRQVPGHQTDAFEFAGELGLDGRLRPVRGILAMAHAAEHGNRCLIAAVDHAAELALFQLHNTLLASTLRDVVDHLKGHRLLAHAGARPPGRQASTLPLADTPLPAISSLTFTPDLADVQGQESACDALVTAAAGGHALLLLGPPGCGKTMLADRLHGLLPPMSEPEALMAAIHLSLAGKGIDPWQYRTRPLRRPHHTISVAGMTGGGNPLRPGEISLAHAGVLMLDEMAEFSRASLEALREPLESGAIQLSRAHGQGCFPSRFQLVATMNPCPCGRPPEGNPPCRCTPGRIARYQAHISQPLLDRIDLWVLMLKTDLHNMSPVQAGSTADARQHVEMARQRQFDRQHALNAHLPLAALIRVAAMRPPVASSWQQLANRHSHSVRGAQRLLSVARTLADLAGDSVVTEDHLHRASIWRRAF